MIDKMAPQAAEYLANKYPDLDFQLKKGRFKVDWVSELPYIGIITVYYNWIRKFRADEFMNMWQDEDWRNTNIIKDFIAIRK